MKPYYYYKEGKTERKINKSMIKILAFSKDSPVSIIFSTLNAKGIYIFEDGSSIYKK